MNNYYQLGFQHTTNVREPTGLDWKAHYSNLRVSIVKSFAIESSHLISIAFNTPIICTNLLIHSERSLCGMLQWPRYHIFAGRWWRVLCLVCFMLLVLLLTSCLSSLLTSIIETTFHTSVGETTLANLAQVIRIRLQNWLWCLQSNTKSSGNSFVNVCLKWWNVIPSAIVRQSYCHIPQHSLGVPRYGDHALILTTDGLVFGMGDNSNSNLAIEGDSSIKRPQQIPDLKNITYVSAGYKKRLIDHWWCLMNGDYWGHVAHDWCAVVLYQAMERPTLGDMIIVVEPHKVEERPLWKNRLLLMHSKVYFSFHLPSHFIPSY